MPADGTDEEMAAHVALIVDLDARGQLVDCSPLAPPEQAVIVHGRAGETQTSGNLGGDEDHVLAGYYVIECPTIAEAVPVAARIPDAATSKVVVHPLLDLDPVPSGPRPLRNG